MSLPTMHAALVALTFTGLVTPRRGVGVSVTSRLRPSRLLPVELRRATDRELHDLRRDLELAAIRRMRLPLSQRQSRLLWFAAMELRGELLNERVASVAAADLDFHRLLVAAARTPLAASVHRAIGRRLLPELTGRMGLIQHDHRMIEAHFAILDALDDSHRESGERALGRALAMERPTRSD